MKRNIDWNAFLSEKKYNKRQVKRINHFILDERKGIREYSRAGYIGLARDEARHLAFLQKEKLRYKDI